MILEAEIIDKINIYLKASEKKVAYIIMFYKQQEEKPYFGVLFKEDLKNIEDAEDVNSTGNIEMEELMSYLYGIVIYDYNKIDFYLDNNKTNPKLNSYIDEAVDYHNATNHLINSALKNILKNTQLFNEDPSGFQNEVQFIYNNEKLTKKYIKTIDDGFKKLSNDFLSKEYLDQKDSDGKDSKNTKDSNEDEDLKQIEQKKNIVKVLKPTMELLTSEESNLFTLKQIEHMMYSIFFDEKLSYDATNDDKKKGEKLEFRRHIKDKVKSQNFEFKSLTKKRDLKMIKEQLKEAIFKILNTFDYTKETTLAKSNPTIDDSTKRICNKILSHIKFYNIYTFNFEKFAPLHKYGIKRLYKKEQNRENSIKRRRKKKETIITSVAENNQVIHNVDFAKSETSYTRDNNTFYAYDFIKIINKSRDFFKSTFGHLTPEFAKQCEIKYKFEHSKEISYKVGGQDKFLLNEDFLKSTSEIIRQSQQNGTDDIFADGKLVSILEEKFQEQYAPKEPKNLIGEEKMNFLKDVKDYVNKFLEIENLPNKLNLITDLDDYNSEKKLLKQKITELESKLKKLGEKYEKKADNAT